MKSSARPDLIVYVPCYNGGTLILKALASLRQQTRSHLVVVVDNGSSDGSIAIVRQQFPDVAVIELGTNIGFGRALNRAVQERPAEKLVFLNQDAECEPDFIEELANASANAEMVAGVLVQQTAPGLIDSAGVVVDETLMPFDHLHGEAAINALEAPPPLGPIGGAALYQSDAFAGVGGFDERFFAYGEDVDIALRLRAEGARCALAGNARALHRHSVTLNSGSTQKNELLGWSRGYMLRRYGVLRQPRRAARALVTESIIGTGQLLVDRNTGAICGRVKGWRAARALPTLPIPEDSILELRLHNVLARRFRQARDTRALARLRR
jgi:N-acetylglucosaminyl-diphospho-decaprenol L-rhamnosyltransferase